MTLRLAPVLAALLLAASCGFKSEPIGRLPSFPQEVVDGTGRRVVVDALPEAVVALDPAMWETAAALGVRLGEPPRESATVDAGRVRRADPDLVLAPHTLGRDPADRLESEVGAPVYVASAPSVRGTQHDILAVGLLTGHASRARSVEDAFTRRVETISNAATALGRKRVFVDLGYFFTPPPDSLAAELVERAGGVNVAADADPGEPFDARALRAARPQAYIAVVGRGTTLAGLRRSPVTRDLPAVKQRRFALVPAEVLTRGGPAIADSLERVARAIHPTLTVAAGQ
jgi:iron complex transport system substrate-binding protein